MTSDWKDLLGALKGSLPEGEETPRLDKNPGSAGHPKTKGKLHVAIERKGRAGKTATIIYGFGDNDEEPASVAAMLKRRLGVGGSARGGEILIQGDLRDKVVKLLSELGYKV